MRLIFVIFLYGFHQYIRITIKMKIKMKMETIIHRKKSGKTISFHVILRQFMSSPLLHFSHSPSLPPSPYLIILTLFTQMFQIKLQQKSFIHRVASTVHHVYFWFHWSTEGCVRNTYGID